MWKARLSDAIRNIKLSSRLVLLVSIMLLLGSIIGVASYEYSSKALIKNTDLFAESTISMARNRIDDLLDNLEDLSTSLAYSSELQLLARDYDGMGKSEKHTAVRSMKAAVSTKLSMHNAITDVIVFTNAGSTIHCFGNEAFQFRPKEEIMRAIANEVYGSKLSIAYYSASNCFEQRLIDIPNESIRNPGFVICRTIVDKRSGARMGILLLKVDDLSLANLYALSEFGEDSITFVIDKAHTIISTSSSEYEIGETAPSYFPTSSEADQQRITEKNLVIDNAKYYCYVSEIANGWEMLTIMSEALIVRDSLQLGKDILILWFTCACLSTLFGMTIYNSITKPINNMISVINSTSSKDYTIKLNDAKMDEIGVLSRQFDMFIDELRQMIHDIVENEKRKRELEIRSLRYQINPHFMSNTLNTIAYLAKIQGSINIDQMAAALNELMIASCDKNGDLITLKDEITYLKDYAYIQEYRFLNNVTYQYNIGEDLHHFLVPSFILQPIVENSLIHGFEGDIDDGIVEIGAQILSNQLVISVQDNGKGMSAEECEGIMLKGHNDSRERLSGIGIANINQRIQLLFGSPYGLNIYSEAGAGTTVRLVLPVIMGDASC